MKHSHKRWISKNWPLMPLWANDNLPKSDAWIFPAFIVFLIAAYVGLKIKVLFF